MDKSTAKKNLIDSVINLERRRGSIDKSDLHAEVINNACLAILKHKFESGSGSSSIEDIFSTTLGSIMDTPEYIKLFTEAAKELFPEHFSSAEAIQVSFSIQTNLSWEGMWDYLRDYFKKNHGFSIDEIESEEKILYSTRHKRFENNILVSESEVARTININLINDKKEILVSIEPTLSPKKGHLVHKNVNEFQYKGSDPDYKFHVYFDEFLELEKFILELTNRKIKIIYFE